MSDEAAGSPGAPQLAVADARGESSVARGAFLLTLGQAATTGLSIVLTAVMARSLGSADFGTLYLVTTMSTFAYVIVDWGKFTYVTVAAARAAAGTIPELIGGTLAKDVAMLVGVAFATFLYTRLLGYDPAVRRYAVLQLICALPLDLAVVYLALFRSRHKMGWISLGNVTAELFLLGTTVLALHLRSGLLGVILSRAVAGAAGLAIAIVLYRRLGLGSPRATAAAARRSLAGGTPFAGVALALQAQPYIDALVLSQLVPTEVLGWYAAGRALLGTLVAPAAILGSASLPRVARFAGDAPALRVEIAQVMRPLLAIGALGVAGTYLFAEFVVGVVYGLPAFAPAIRVVQAFAPVLFLIFIDSHLGMVAQATGRGAHLAAAKALAIAVTAGLELLLVPRFQHRYGNGGIGVALALGGASLTMIAVTAAILPRGVLSPALLIDAVRALAAAAGAVVCVLALPPLPVAVAMPLCIAVFAVLAAAFGLLRRSDLGALRAAIAAR